MEVIRLVGVGGGLVFITRIHHGMQASAGHRIPAGEQSHIPVSGDEPFGYVACNRFPGAVLPRRRPPSYRRKDSHSFFGLCHHVKSLSPNCSLPPKSRLALIGDAITLRSTVGFSSFW